ncbi:WD domain, g-beta repeat domain-containing protein [Cordyceps javanica]|uniref:WD domain, g-beta repeat domain-containing protein n=1 Tax=Cordyceps javanica TaxID=43265 RepID=A0A545UV09_9HYPO|nr:WD domain, g-beta repeat domain-containing protein [Cordyceps javanica]TQW05353.1 WD domain, g-beta repeat domain-containing protein [Cordyceps javanica]
MHYSSSQFRQDWRYAVDQEFTTSDGQPFPYAPGGHQAWGDEVAKIPLQDASESCVSSDGRRIAIAVGNDVHLINTETQETISVLKSHLTTVASLEFHLNDANMLLTGSSTSSQWSGGKVMVDVDALITVWELDERTLALNKDTIVSSSVVEAGAAAVATELAHAGTKLPPEALEELRERMAPNVEHVVRKHTATGHARLFGRLRTSFGSSVFSPSGRLMVYLPGNSPRSNDVDKWDMCVCRTDDFRTPILTLSGHTDNIVWMGWNNEETLLASVSWDSTVRVWDVATGETVHVFRTGDRCQNWTGGFSPNSKYLVATDGTPKVHVYDLEARASPGSQGSAATDEAYWVYTGPERQHGWHRAVAWHPNSKWLAVGQDQSSELLLLDVEGKSVLQRRTLSTAASRPDREELRVMLGSSVGVSQIRFADNGRKIVVWTHGDDSIEVFDLEREQKWRFGRGGTEDVPGADAWRDEHGKVTSAGGRGMSVWERDSRLWMASLDGDAVRLWSIELE